MKITAAIVSALSYFDAPPAPPDPALLPVVIVHGIHATGDDMGRLARHLRAQGREVFTPTLLPNRGEAPIEELARQLFQYTNRELRGRRFDLIGFSMGGLVTRYYIQRLGGHERVGHLVTMATPHHGTHMARLMRARGYVQMRPGSDFLCDLASDADTLRRVKFTSFHTPLDTMIVPARSSDMPQAKNIRMWASMHPSFVLEKRCIRAVADALR